MTFEETTLDWRTFGARVNRVANMLSGLGVPDIRGRIGTPSYYTSEVSFSVKNSNEFSVEVVELPDNRGEIETEHPGYLGAQDTYYVGTLKGVGRIYQQTFIDTYSKVALIKLYDRKNALVAAEMLNDRVLPFFEQQGVRLLRVLTDRGSEYCGSLEHHEYQLFLAIEDIDHTRMAAARQNDQPLVPDMTNHRLIIPDPPVWLPAIGRLSLLEGEACLEIGDTMDLSGHKDRTVQQQ